MGRRDLFGHVVGLVMASLHLIFKPYHKVALNGKNNISMYVSIMTVFDNSTVTAVVLT